MIPSVFLDALNYVLNLNVDGILRVFWYFVIFDTPRYIMSDIYIFCYEIYRKIRSRKEDDFIRTLKENPPLVSIIIPALNEQDTISWTVRSLLEQTYQNLELIVVDDGSTDHTPELCRRLSKKDNVFYYRFMERAGKSAVLNYGLKFANGKFVVFVDSDTTFDRDAIYELMKVFSDPKVGGASGNLRARNGDDNLLTSLQQIEYMFTISIGRRIRSRFGILPIISGAFGGFRRELISLETSGGHEPGPGNDSDLAIRVRKKGYKIAFVPEAVCLTNVPAKMTKLIKQRSRWDRNMIKNRVRKHKDVFNPFSKNFKFSDLVTFVDSLFFHVGLSFITALYLIDIAFNFTPFLPLLLFINFCIYFCAESFELLIAVILAKKKEDLKLALYLPLFNPYKIFFKFVRLKAYGQEFFFRYSFRDPFAPYKVRQQMIKW
ncbi:MAG: glycosyltransferase [bacterium]